MSSARLGAILACAALLAGTRPAHAQEYAHPLAPWTITKDSLVARLRGVGLRVQRNGRWVSDAWTTLASRSTSVSFAYDGGRLIAFGVEYRPGTGEEARSRFAALADSLQRALGPDGRFEVRDTASSAWEWRHPTGEERVELDHGSRDDYERGGPRYPFVRISRRGPGYSEWLMRPRPPREQGAPVARPPAP